MAIKLLNGKYACSFCKKEYTDPIKADNCRDSHDIIYVAIPRDELNRLINFLFIHDPKLITEKLVRRLQDALTNSVKTIDKFEN